MKTKGARVLLKIKMLHGKGKNGVFSCEQKEYLIVNVSLLNDDYALKGVIRPSCYSHAILN